MSNLFEFQDRYHKNIMDILEEMPELDRGEMLRPFWESPFLPEEAQQLLMLAEAVPVRAEEIVGGLAFTALGQFLARYFAAISAYIKRELGLDVSVEELSSKEQALLLRRKFKKAGLQDAVLSWFLKEGVEITGALLSGLRVKDAEDLAVLVSCLEYRAVFLGGGEEKESYGYLLDVLEGLKRDLEGAGLLREPGMRQEDVWELPGDLDLAEIRRFALFGEYKQGQAGYADVKIGSGEEAVAREEDTGGPEDYRPSFEVA